MTARHIPPRRVSGEEDGRRPWLGDRHARPARVAHAGVGTAPRVRDREVAQGYLGGDDPRRGPCAVHRAASARGARLRRERVGRLREQSPGAVLPAHPERAQAPGGSQRALGALRRSRLQDPPRGPRRGVMREIRIPGIRRVLRVSWSTDTVNREIDEEIQFHIEARTEELVRLGASTKDARERAEAEFGDLRSARRELSAVDNRRLGRAHREELFMSFIDDLRYSWRSLVRRPALLVVTTIALAIGIAANAVMFGIVDQLLIQPPALVTAPDDVVRVYYRRTSRGEVYTSPTTTYRVISTLRNEVKSFAQVAAMFRRSYSLGSGTEARSVDVGLVSGNYFSLLGILPLRSEERRVGKECRC